MNNKFALLLLLSFSSLHFASAQQETYTVKLAPFSSNKYDEFSPVYYKNGIVFCTNRKSGSLADYSNSKGKGTFKIYYIDTTGKVSWRKAELFSKNLKTRFNDGPVTFDSDFDTIYYSRNLRTEGKLRELSTTQNKLGLFSAVRTGKKWNNIQEMRFNNELFNMTTPYLSPDGSKLFFSSDRSGGYGGLDIYYSQWKSGYWDDPINLGPMVNTRGNESFPFISGAGELFFSSDGREGIGGKDIFVTKQLGSGWYPPVRLESPINSESDDFGIFSDPLMKEGYFSSKRGNTIDIYHFKSDNFHFWFCEPQKENQYCFTISDTGSINVDTLRFKYVWDFGDGSKMRGLNAKYCFPGPGTYNINLDIVDSRTGKLFFRKLKYDITVLNIDQPFITSPDVSVIGQTVELDGLKSFCPGYTISGYFWDFGDGNDTIGAVVNHKFIKSGEYNVRMGLILKSQNSEVNVKRVVSKNIRVYNEDRDMVSSITVNSVNKNNLLDIGQNENVKINKQFSAETDFKNESVFQVVLSSSLSKLALNDPFFRKVPSEYSVKEIFDAGSGLYSYIIDQQMSLMATYPAYTEMIASGYSETIVRIFVLKESADKELYNVKKNYSLLTDINFDTSNRLTNSAYIMLDQLAMIMNKYPGIKLEVGVHTDNQGTQSNNVMLSQFRAQIIVNYLITRGIRINRLTAKGYGDARPIASNIYPTERRVNRRIDFTIINE